VNLYPFLNYTVPLYPIIITYAIIRHRLMDIKFVLRKSSVYLVSLSTIIISAIAVKYIAIIFFTGISDQLDYLILISAVMVFLPIRNYYYKIANKYFFTSLYDSRKVIGKLSDRLRSTLEERKIHKYVADILMDSFHTKAVGILIQDKNKKKNKKQEEDQYTLRYNDGFHTHGRKKFPGNKKLCNLFLKHNKSIVVEEIKNASYKEFKGTIDLLASLGAEVVTPLNVKGKTIGLIILGRKESGDMYNDQDLRVLEIVGAQAAIAIENAVLYEAAKNFNVKLKKEVKKATTQLRSANKKLKELDTAKSEFISIASHQLRTPLTIIKGYISMLLEGSFGRLNEKETDPLKKVYESNERLIQLVEDLLDISRIESGKLQLNFKEMRLEEITDSVAEEFTNSAKSKGLDLIYKKPAQPLPKVKIDKEKIRQVVINLIDNAIKYTGRGSVAVSMDKIDGGVYFCVADTGAGISEEELPSLFKKFSRGKATSLIDANGTGLGLYVGKMMIEAHHGKIWAESEGRDKGSKFCFTLPAGKAK
ncbi:GAF domain-containing sensor histidine kinase, partial [Patescibacteria group bacterium]|nr:GAF domain-containing sensor histidine kinase [Patescibacteria group bacterium]